MIGDNKVPMTTNKDSVPSNTANLVALLSGLETNARQAYAGQKFYKIMKSRPHLAPKRLKIFKQRSGLEANTESI